MGVRSSRSYLSNARTKAVASDRTKKKQCAMPSIAASFVRAKRNFQDVLLDLEGINFRIFGISIDPGHPSDVFDVGSGSRHQARSRRRSVSCDRVNVNKPKLRNFDRPLGLPGHLQ